MKIICVDNATKVSGYSIWHNKTLVEYGERKVSKESLPPLERMREMYFLIKDLIDSENPDFFCLENCQFQQNQGVFQVLSQNMGCIMALLFERDIGFKILESTAWKSFMQVKSRKRADQKIEVQEKVKDLYGIECSQDEADAVGIGHYIVNHIKDFS